jgi:hypothetical protein
MTGFLNFFFDLAKFGYKLDMTIFKKSATFNIVGCYLLEHKRPFQIWCLYLKAPPWQTF